MKNQTAWVFNKFFGEEFCPCFTSSLACNVGQNTMYCGASLRHNVYDQGSITLIVSVQPSVFVVKVL